MITKNKLLKYLPWLVMLCGLGGNAWADGVNEPIPSYYQEAGISKTRSYINQNDAEHIDPFTGKLQFHFVDLFIPGNGGLDLKVQRSYNSINEYHLNDYESSPVGLGWTLHFGRVLKWTGAYLCDAVNIPKRNAVFELPDGSRRVFYPSLETGLSWVTTDFWRAECGNDPLVALKIYSPDGTIYEMGTTGMTVGSGTNVQNATYVSKIIDRNGNWLSFTYQNFTSGVTGVKTVSSSDGRSVVFNYTGSNLTSITDLSGAQIWATYTYAASGDLAHSYLKEVLRPHGQTWKFEYNSASPGQRALRQITYPTGGTVDYTYSLVQFGVNASIPQSTVVAQKVATRIDPTSTQIASPLTDTWTYTYKPASTALLVESVPNNPGAVQINAGPCTTSTINLPGRDSTTINGPDGLNYYIHYGVNSVSTGFVFLIGAEICHGNSNQVTGPYWQPIVISNQTNIRPGNTLAFDPDTVAVLSAGQSISRAGETFTTQLSNFDGYGNAGTMRETGNEIKTTQYTYNNIPSKWIIRQKKNETVTLNSESYTTTRNFDLSGNLLNETRAGVPVNYTYHASGDVASRTDARSKSTQFSNYHRGIPQSEQQPENVLITRVVSDAGNVTSETDGEGATTSFSYDSLNRVTGITHPIGNTVSVTWEPNSRTVKRGSYVAESTFDGFGREVQLAHKDLGTGETITQKYQNDSLGRRIFASYPNSELGTKTSYDMLSRPTYIYNEYLPYANGLPTDSWSSVRRYFYSNYRVEMMDERNISHTSSYRYFGTPNEGELIQITKSQGSSASNTVLIQRNIMGQPIRVSIDQALRSFSYDTHFFLTSSTEPETGLTLMGRDAVGNLVTRQVGSSDITTYTYDGRNRLVSINYPVGTPSVVKEYYKDDKVKLINNGIAKREYVFNANKNLINETLTMGSKAFPTIYTYNDNDAHASIQYASLRTVTYSPDAFGRPRQALPYINSIMYHSSGQASSYTYANGVTSTISLNARQWPKNLKFSKNGYADYINSTYAYDSVGNTTSISDSVDSSYNRTMTYDFQDRLQTVYGSWGNDTIFYDNKSNILSYLGSTNLNFTYDQNTSQRLTAVSGSKAYSLQYDVYGNVINNGTNTFAYNDAANLKCAKCGQAGEILHDYDGNNQRVRSVKGGVATYFLYGQGGQLLWEETPGAIPNVTPNGTRKEYIYMGGKQIATREEVLP